jgi:hypothetical protein
LRLHRTVPSRSTPTRSETSGVSGSRATEDVRQAHLASSQNLDTAQTASSEDFAVALAAALDFAALLETFTIGELKKVCSTHELPTTGSKTELIARILEQAPSGRSDRGW